MHSNRLKQLDLCFTVWAPEDIANLGAGLLVFQKRRTAMLNWIIIFLVLAAIAATLGFGGLAGTFAGIAKILAALFVVLFLIMLLY
jgi:uncharacterized membrane protein YtjA (UPF0391 family)